MGERREEREKRGKVSCWKRVRLDVLAKIVDSRLLMRFETEMDVKPEQIC